MRKNNLMDKEAKSTATKYATKLYAECKKPGQKGLSASQVSAFVEKKLGVKVSKRTIQQNVKKGGSDPP